MSESNVIDTRLVEYYVRPFSLFSLSTHATICYSAGGAIAVEDESIIDFLRGLEAYKSSHVTHTLLHNELVARQVDVQEALSFFIDEVHLLVPSSKPSVLADSAGLISDSPEGAEIASEVEGITGLKTELYSLQPDSSLTGWKKGKRIVILFLENYDASVIRELYTKDDSCGSFFVTSYILHDTFVIDPIFSSQIATPCHFCIQDWWASVARGKSGTPKASWYEFYRLSNSTPSLPASLLISRAERWACMYYLLYRVKQFAGTDNEPFAATDSLAMSFELRLPLGSHSRDLVPHSPTCDCLKGAW